MTDSPPAMTKIGQAVPQVRPPTFQMLIQP
jgi:hypothetical protein